MSSFTGPRELMRNANPRRWDRGMRRLALVVALGGLVRLAWIVYALRLPAGIGDAGYYVHAATSLADGKGYLGLGNRPSALWPPGYPLALSVPLWVLGRIGSTPHVALAVGALNLVLGTATVLLVGLAGRRLFSERTGIVAAAVFALFPSAVMYTGVALSETTSTFFVALTMTLLVWRPWTRAELPGHGRLFAVGLAAGAAMLVRPTFLGAFVLVPVALALVGRRLGPVLSGGLWLLFGAALVIAPWAIRNEVALHTAAPFSLTTGINLCLGNQPGATGAFDPTKWCLHDYRAPLTGADEISNDATLRRRAIDWATSHPVQEAGLVALKTVALFADDHGGTYAVQEFGTQMWMDGRMVRTWSMIADAYFFIALTLAAIGFLVWRPEGDGRRLVLLLLIAGAIWIVWPFFGDPRFKQAMLPMLCLGAAVGIEATWRLRRSTMMPAIADLGGSDTPTASNVDPCDNAD